jgi:F-type H+-transporting ATPase subunit epsilon
MHVTLAKVHENIFSGDAVSITLPTAAGEVTILPKHEALVSTLKPGTITVRTTAGTQTFPVETGVLEVSSDQVTVLL